MTTQKRFDCNAFIVQRISKHPESRHLVFEHIFSTIPIENLTCPSPAFCVYARVTLSPKEVQEVPEGSLILRPPGMTEGAQVQFPEAASDLRSFVPCVEYCLEFHQGIVFQEFGWHSLDILLDGQAVKTLPLHVRRIG